MVLGEGMGAKAGSPTASPIVYHWGYRGGSTYTGTPCGGPTPLL